MKTNDGDAAFPCQKLLAADSREGMSLRDYFASRALAAIIANLPLSTCSDPYEGTEGITEKSFSIRMIHDAAMLSYDYADAMVAERNKP